MDSSNENVLWGNPCDYKSNEKSPVDYTADLAKKVASQAKSAQDSMAKYKNDLALKLHSYDNFDVLLKMWSSNEWLRNLPGGLPKEKVLYERMKEPYMDGLMKDLDQKLPEMYRALKMVVAGLNSVIKDFKLNSNIPLDSSLERNITKSSHDVRAVLCYFNDVMSARNLKSLPLLDSEVSSYKEDDKLLYALLVYRDTLNYLEYLIQVFERIYEEDSIKAK